MLIRVVRMSFLEDKVEEFMDIFEGSRNEIRAFPGCRHLELFQDWSAPNVFTTISHWDDGTALEAYRASPLFRDVWTRTRVLFDERPVAFSLKPVSGGGKG